MELSRLSGIKSRFHILIHVTFRTLQDFQGFFILLYEKEVTDCFFIPIPYGLRKKMLNRQSISSRKSAIPEISENIILKDKSIFENHIIRPREK